MDQNKLEKYSFLWSEVRLVIAALALFLGGVPPVYRLGFVGVAPLLTLCWVISGVAAVYLLFRWNKTKLLFGGKNKWDMWAFFVMVISGINLGLAGLLARNIGMSILSGQLVFLVVGIIYLASAYRLWKRWKAHGEKLF